MMTKFITEITTRFNPFSPQARTARLFLSIIPPSARTTGVNIKTVLLNKASKEPASLSVKFKDGKELKFDCEKTGIKGLVEDVDRHSRGLQKAADLRDG
ncbi:39S ribosomal protein L53/MRP-L53-domain-containing protein [Plectosphaerella plurivora]|uniref:Large ribosomal subunit protein mL53 n=1 Tax=Plectosphaerella plurivora TaxID=936078 RepID=A0A9P9ABB4_9PEZI|nr:39S ribosomal protein L53/MRP-L53-domain-containing protein [Plectosphaerella plurivora]